jgi:hypothetical protein
MDEKTRKELSPDRQNWRIAVDLANTWRKIMDVPAVDYPYPGDFVPKSRISP